MSSTSDKKPTGTAHDGTNAGPIVVDFGKHKPKLVKQLRQGRGKLANKVNQTVEELRAAGTISTSAQPVIIVVRERRRKNLFSLLNV